VYAAVVFGFHKGAMIEYWLPEHSTLQSLIRIEDFSTRNFERKELKNSGMLLLIYEIFHSGKPILERVLEMTAIVPLHFYFKKVAFL
jgi:hypothetical protein